MAATTASAAPIDSAKVLDLTKNLNPRGQLDWDAPAGNWTVLRMRFTTNGTQNRSAPDGGVGLEVDKYN